MSESSQEHRHERRKFVRVDIYAVTRYLCPLRHQEVGVQTRISDISENGAMILTFDEGIPIDTEISINFVLPGNDKMIVGVRGKIRHSGLLESNIYRSGVEFLKLRIKDKQAIRNYVSLKLRKS